MLSLVLLATVASASVIDLSFDDFVNKFNKVYTPEELVSREELFNHNLANMQKLRELNPHATFAVNRFSDLSKEEFSVKRSGYKPMQRPQPLINEETSTAPNSTKIDWREKKAVSKVLDQGQCGCCWAISVTESVASAWFIAGKGPLNTLSFQQLICCDCTTDDVGCNGGDPHLAYNYIMKAGGLEPAKAYPFTDGGQVMPWENRCNTDQKQKGRCSECKYDESKVVANITGYRNVTVGSEFALSQALVNGPVSICIDSDPWQTYDGGILSKCGRSLDHCVQAVGFDTTHTPAYWIVKNSWGADWGEDGYIRIAMGNDACGIADAATYPLV